MLKSPNRWATLNWVFLSLALFLRLYKIDSFHLDMDELSGIFRAQASTNWNDHIIKGVMIDGHPAGVQTLLYLWIRIIGLTPTLIKICLALLSVGSIWIFSEISKNLFGEKAAVFTTILLGLSWWFIDLGIWIRPYVFGGFFTSLMAYFLIKYEKKQSNYYVLGWAISLGINSSIHYFSFLTSVIFSGLWMLQHRKSIIHFIKYGCISLGILLIQYPIIKYQLGVGGLDWLGRPTIEFFVNHLFYIFGQSLFIAIPIAVLMFISLAYRYPEPKSLKRNAIVLLGTWILPMVIGFFYSIYQKPVLQNNALFFSTPFLFVFLSGIIGKLEKFMFTVGISIVTLCSLAHVFALKKRFTVENKEIFYEHISLLKNYDPNAVYLLHGPKDVYQFYSKEVLRDSAFVLNAKNIFYLNDLKTPLVEIDSILRILSHKPCTVKCGFISGTDPTIFPYLCLNSKDGCQISNSEDLHYKINNVEVTNFIGGQTLLIRNFRVNDSAKRNTMKFKSSLTKTKIDWDSNLYLKQSIALRFSKQNKGNDDVQSIHKNDVLVILFPPIISQNDIHFISILSDEKDKTIDYRYTNCNLFKNLNSSVLHAIKLADIPSIELAKKLNFHWENSKLEQVPPIQILKIKGNPIQYGIAPKY